MGGEYYRGFLKCELDRSPLRFGYSHMIHFRGLSLLLSQTEVVIDHQLHELIKGNLWLPTQFTPGFARISAQNLLRPAESTADRSPRILANPGRGGRKLFR